MLMVNTHIFSAYPVEVMLKVLKGSGIKGVELWAGFLPFKTESNYRLAREVFEGSGIKISGLLPDPGSSGNCGLNLYDPSKRAESVKFFENNAKVAKALGASMINVAEGNPPQGMNETEAWKNLISAMKESARVAADSGIMIVNEFHPGLFASTLEKAPRLFEEVGSGSYKACLDFCHAYVITGGHPEKMIRAVGKNIGLAHIADGDGLPSMHLPPGDGKVDVKKCLEEVKKTGSKPAYSLCLYGYSFPEDGVRKSLKALKAMGEL